MSAPGTTAPAIPDQTGHAPAERDAAGAGPDAGLLSGSALGRVGSLRRLAPVMNRHRPQLVLTVVTAAGNQLSGLAAAVTAAWLVGRAATGAQVGDLGGALVLLAILTVAKGALAWVESWVAHDMAFRVMLDMRVDVYDGLERLAPAWLLGRRTGDVAAAALGDVEALEWFYAHTVAQVAVTVLTPAGALAALAVIDPALAAALAPFVVGIATVPLWLLRRGERQGLAIRRGIGEVQADVSDGVQGLRELVLNGAARRHTARVQQAARRLGRAQRANASRIGVENGVTEALLAGAMVAVLATGSTLVARGALDPALYPVAVVLAGVALTPVLTLTGGIRNLGVLRATASRVVAVIDTAPRVTERTTAVPRPTRQDEVSAGDIPDSGSPAAASVVAFDGVRFGYRRDTPVLTGVTFEVTPGRTTALVGASGAGKSTCANLLLRFWDVDDGAIRLDGIDIRDLTLGGLRRVVSLIPQDPYLFHGSLADNIRLARPDATAAEVTDAAARAQVTEFSDHLPDGLDTPVGERGVALSGGQRQRVALARGLLRGAPVLVLDEAVSAVDLTAEALLQTALTAARGQLTTLVIAHRLSTIAAADQVVVLRAGRVGAVGTHPELLDTDPAYRDLLARQIDTRHEGLDSRGDARADA